MSNDQRVNLCRVNNCREVAYLIYYGKSICLNHWAKYWGNPRKLKRILGIPQEPDIVAVHSQNNKKELV